MQSSEFSTEHVSPSSAVSGEDIDLDTALGRFAATANCPDYLATAYANWRAQLR